MVFQEHYHFKGNQDFDNFRRKKFYNIENWIENSIQFNRSYRRKNQWDAFSGGSSFSRKASTPAKKCSFRLFEIFSPEGGKIGLGEGFHHRRLKKFIRQSNFYSVHVQEFITRGAENKNQRECVCVCVCVCSVPEREGERERGEREWWKLIKERRPLPATVRD